MTPRYPLLRRLPWRSALVAPMVVAVGYGLLAVLRPEAANAQVALLIGAYAAVFLLSLGLVRNAVARTTGILLPLAFGGFSASDMLTRADLADISTYGLRRPRGWHTVPYLILPFVSMVLPVPLIAIAVQLFGGN